MKTEFLRVEVEGLPYGTDGKLTDEVKGKIRTQIIDRLRTTVPPEKLAAAVEKTMTNFEREFSTPVTEAGAANLAAALDKAAHFLEGLDESAESLARLLYANDVEGGAGQHIYVCGRVAAAIMAARVMLQGASLGLKNLVKERSGSEPTDNPAGRA